jgi:translocation and assembly module TamB
MRHARKVAAGALLALAIVVGPVLCLRLPFARRLVAANVNRALSSAFVGHVVVDRIGEISLTAAGGIDAHVEADDGGGLVKVDGVRARVSIWKLLRSVLGHGDIAVDLPEVSVAGAEVTIDPDENGTLRIARAFASRPHSSHGEAARGVSVRLERIIVEHATVHVHPKAAPDLEADLSGVEAGLAFEAGKLSVDLTRGPLVVRGLPGGVQAVGRVEAHLTQPPLRVRATWHGAVGAIRDDANLAYDDGRVDAKLDVTRATPEQMRAVWPECPLRAATAAHAEAHGTLPRVDVLAHADVGVGTIDVSGPVELGPPVEATLHVDAQKFDVQAVSASTPSSALTASGDVSITAKPTGAVDGKATVQLASGVLGSTQLPKATARGEFARTESGEPSARVELTVGEPYGPTVITAKLAQQPPQKGGSLLVTFEGQSTSVRLEDVPALGAAASGSANARATGTLDLTAGTVDAQLTVAVDDLAARGVTLDHASAVVHASRKLTAPSLDVAIDGEGLDAGPMQLSAVHGQANVAIEGGATLRDVDLELTGDSEPVRARAALVRFSDEGLRVDDAVLEGLGAPLAATVSASQSAIVLKATSAGVDLARLRSFVRTPIGRGTLSVDVDATVNAGAAEGRLALGVQHVAFRNVQNANARIEAVLHGRHASGRATANVEDIGTLELFTSSVDIGQGPLLTPSPWRKTWGSVEFDAHVDLARLAARLPPNELPVTDVLGTLDVQGRVSRDSADDATPAVEVTSHTTGLVLAGRRGSGAWRVEGLNTTLHATVDGNTGKTVLEAQVSDAAGTIVGLDANSNAVPYAVLFSDQNPLEALRSTPFDAQLRVPSRAIDSLPPALGLEGLGGDLQANLSWHGTPVAPTIDVAATVNGGRVSPAVMTRELDVSLAGHYDGAQLAATVRALTRGRKVLDASALVSASATDVLAGLGGGSVPWKASAHAKVDGLTLQSIAVLEDKQVRGKVTGQLDLDGLHEDARANLALSVEGLKVGDVTGRSSSVKVIIDGRSVDASARLDQGDGFVEGRAHFGTHWGAAIVPALDPSQRAEASLSAKQFRAAFLLPFVSKWLTELDGRIDANARVATTGGDMVMRPEGSVTLNGGTFELASFGGEFHGASATVTMTPDGIVRLENAVAHGTSGSIQAAATARLDGASLASVRASVRLPAKDPLPLVFDGVKLGMLDGAFDVAADRSEGRALAMVVDAREAHVELASDASSVDVQSLGDLGGVKVGVSRGASDFVEVPLDSAHMDVAQRAGKGQPGGRVVLRLHDVEVRRGTDLEVRLEGQPTIQLGGATQVTGQIRLMRGTIDVYGKPFTIDRGTVTFVGEDPTNPQVVLTASWAAPDGQTRIYADFVGPLKTGKVKLRSEPSKSQSEILALVLFGTTDNQKTSANGTSAQVSPAAAVAGGAATQPINKALGGIDRALNNLGMAGGISTKIDTSQTTPRPEVEVQIARDISLQIAWVLGVPPPGTNPDSTLVTLDWRFLRKWSLETTVGDMGTSILDVVWQHRY